MHVDFGFGLVYGGEDEVGDASLGTKADGDLCGGFCWWWWKVGFFDLVGGSCDGAEEEEFKEDGLEYVDFFLWHFSFLYVANVVIFYET